MPWHIYDIRTEPLDLCWTHAELYVAAKWAWIEGLVRSRAPVIHRLSGLGSRVRPAPARGPPIRAVRLSIPLFNHSAPLHPSRVVNNDVQAYAQLYVTLQ